MSLYSRRNRERATCGTAEAFVPFMGFDAYATIEYQITDFGYPASWDEPGEGPEFEIESITLRVENEDGEAGPEFDLTGRLLTEFCCSQRINEAVYETIADY